MAKMPSDYTCYVPKNNVTPPMLLDCGVDDIAKMMKSPHVNPLKMTHCYKLSLETREVHCYYWLTTECARRSGLAVRPNLKFVVILWVYLRFSSGDPPAETLLAIESTGRLMDMIKNERPVIVNFAVPFTIWINPSLVIHDVPSVKTRPILPYHDWATSTRLPIMNGAIEHIRHAAHRSHTPPPELTHRYVPKVTLTDETVHELLTSLGRVELARNTKRSTPESPNADRLGKKVKG